MVTTATAVVTGLARGAIDAVVGTHRLLSADVRVKNLGLLIIDEEQRFGVAHKEKLKRARTQVDVLTLTATPIPRTLQLAMSGLRDLSIIATPPADRRSIRTFFARDDAAISGDAATVIPGPDWAGGYAVESSRCYSRTGQAAAGATVRLR